MQVYVCAHCYTVLGPVIEGEPEPVCPDHPDGPKELSEQDDGDPVNP